MEMSGTESRNGTPYQLRRDAQELFERGDFSESIRCLTESIKMDPTDPYAYGNRGTAYMVLGDHRRALKDYQKVLELGPKDEEFLATVYSNMGICLLELESPEKAVECCIQALLLQPFNPNYHYSLALALVELGEYEDALEKLDAAESLNPREEDMPKILSLRSMVYLRLKMPLEALNDLKALARLAPEEVETYFLGMGGVYYLVGDYPNALYHYQRYLDLSRDDPDEEESRREVLSMVRWIEERLLEG